MQNLETITRLVCQVAREAGSYIRKERAGFSVEKVERKHAHDYVSYVDKGSEQLIVSRLREILPEAGFITEEGTTRDDASPITQHPSPNTQHPSPLTWVVDPLDGTTNFIHGYAPYAVSIALIQGNEQLVGVVYEIVSDECFYAWKDGKAHIEMRNEKGEMRNDALHVGNSDINDALLCLQLPYNSDAYKPVIKRLIDRFYGNVGSIRMIGSAAMALCYVAAGRQWDYMAGALIVKEAGGKVSNYEGVTTFTQGDSIIATNGVIHEKLLEAVKAAE